MLQSSVVSPREFLVGLERGYVLIHFSERLEYNHTAKVGQAYGLKCGYIFSMVSASLASPEL